MEAQVAVAAGVLEALLAEGGNCTALVLEEAHFCDEVG